MAKFGKILLALGTKLTKIQIKKTTIIILFFCLLFTSVISVISLKIGRIYYQNYTYYCDPAIFLKENIKTYEKTLDEVNYNQIMSRINLSLQELRNNAFHPLRTIPMIFFAQNLLDSPFGGLFTSIPAILIFSFILGLTVYKRSKTLFFTITVIFLFFSAPLLIDPFWGISAFWLDLTASFYLASALISLINWHNDRKNYWLLLFSLFLNASILSRCIMAFFSFYIMFPILVYSLIKYWKSARKIFSCIIKPLLIILIIIMPISGAFVLYNFSYAYHYYTNPWDINRSLGIAMDGFFGAFIELFSYLYIIILVITGLYIMLWDIRLKHYEDFFLKLWIILTIPIFFIIILRSSGPGAKHAFLVYFPVVFFALLCPFSDRAKKTFRVHFIVKSAIIIIAGIYLSISGYINANAKSMQPSEADKNDKKLALLISDFINSFQYKENVKWACCFNEIYHFKSNLETYYRFGYLPKMQGHPIYTLVPQLWEDGYHGLTITEICDSVLYNIDDCDFVIAYHDTIHLDTLSVINNEISRYVAKKVATFLKNTPSWKPVLIIDTKKYSELIFFINEETVQKRGGNKWNGEMKYIKGY
ncbi:MAG: hypothetical protein HY738_03490 [Bacteroidia bacterium]|nr:hypothetical protein [Bacteroidia bacterium]